MSWIISVAVVVIIGFLLDREIHFYEGVHLGPPVQWDCLEMIYMGHNATRTLPMV